MLKFKNIKEFKLIFNINFNFKFIIFENIVVKKLKYLQNLKFWGKMTLNFTFILNLIKIS